MNLDHGNISIYIPKFERNFVRILLKFIGKKAEESEERPNFSSFFLKCLKTYINQLSKEDKSLFEECAYELAQKEKPKAAQFVDQFIRGEQWID